MSVNCRRARAVSAPGGTQACAAPGLSVADCLGRAGISPP